MPATIELTAAQFAQLVEEMRRHALRSNPSEVMSVPELALFLGVGEDLVRARTQEGVLPSKKLGERVLYHREAIRAWLAKPDRNHRP